MQNSNDGERLGCGLVLLVAAFTLYCVIQTLRYLLAH